MLNESNIIFDNIKTFRSLITEAVGENDIVNYINDHEYIYIYYTGDETNKRGYRTIRPYVLGTSKAGNLVVRAWQDRGKSVSFNNKPTRKNSFEHDYWQDEEGATKPGWRMFRLDRIEKIYPTGKKFNKTDGRVMIPPKYKEGSDADMTNIIAYVSTKTEPEIEPTSGATTQTGVKKTRWDNFSLGDKNKRKITPADVTKLSDIASRVLKMKKDKFLVVINNKNEFELIEIKDKNKVPSKAIVGNLPNLYDTLVKKNAPTDDAFFKKAKADLQNKIPEEQPEIKEENIPTIPHSIKTFFK
jgi:WYL domain